LKKDGGKRRYVVVGELFNDGESIEALATRFQVRHGRIISNLMRFVRDGNTLRNGDGFVELISASADEQKIAIAAFEELGTEFLKPVFEKMGGTVSYDDLKIIRMMVMNKQN